MFSLTLYLPHELAQDLEQAAAGSGRPRAEIMCRALGEQRQRRERARFTSEDDREAALGCADAVRPRYEATAPAEEALECGTEALARTGSAGSVGSDGEGEWWR